MRSLLPAILAMAAVVLASNILVQFLLGDWLTWGALTYPIAFLVTDLMNRLHGPAAARRVVEGAEVVKAGEFQGFDHLTPGDKVTADKAVAAVDASTYSALLLPGGVANPDKMRLQERAVEIVGEFMDEGKIVAAICHAPWTLIEADVLKGRTLTSWPTCTSPRKRRCCSTLNMLHPVSAR